MGSKPEAAPVDYRFEFTALGQICQHNAKPFSSLQPRVLLKRFPIHSVAGLLGLIQISAY
jgi:hypothetical protein